MCFVHLFIYFNYLLYCTSVNRSYTTHLLYVASLCSIYPTWFIHDIFNLFLLISHLFVCLFVYMHVSYYIPFVYIYLGSII